MGRVVRLEMSGEIFGANYGEVILDRKHFSFLVQVIDRGYLNAAGGYAEGWVLDSLEFLNNGQWGVGEPNGSCIHEKGSDKEHIGDRSGFLLLTPVSTSKGLDDVDTGWSPGDYIDLTWALILK